jgi:hypothetical protein
MKSCEYRVRPELLVQNPLWITNKSVKYKATTIKTLWPACTATSSKDRWIEAYSIDLMIPRKLSCLIKKEDGWHMELPYFTCEMLFCRTQIALKFWFNPFILFTGSEIGLWPSWSVFSAISHLEDFMIFYYQTLFEITTIKWLCFHS